MKCFQFLFHVPKDVILMITPAEWERWAVSCEWMGISHSSIGWGSPQSVSEHTRRTFSHMNKSANLVELWNVCRHISEIKMRVERDGKRQHLMISCRRCWKNIFPEKQEHTWLFVRSLYFFLLINAQHTEGRQKNERIFDFLSDIVVWRVECCFSFESMKFMMLSILERRYFHSHTVSIIETKRLKYILWAINCQHGLEKNVKPVFSIKLPVPHS